MAVKQGHTEPKTTPEKLSAALTGIKLSECKFVDETGDITDKVIEALGGYADEVSFKITVELPSEDE